MKKIFYLTFTAIACLAIACHKDTTLTTLAPVSFTSVLKSSASSVVLTSTTDATNVMTFTWPAVVYPVQAHVTYTLKADVPSDTTGATPWANATSITVGGDILTKTLTGSDLNTLAFALGLTANTPGTIVFRVQAYQDRNAFSNAVTVSVSPYKKVIIGAGYPVLYLPGTYQGWSPAAAGTVAAEQTNIYEGYIYMPAGTGGSPYDFKFTSAPDFNHINYGFAAAGTLSTNGTAGDLVLPGAGFYELVANTSKLTWSYLLVNSWSIIGDATPGGWSTDTDLSYNATTGLWTVTAAMLSTGSFKFRVNHAWNIDFGIDAKGNLQYADNPAYPYNGTLNNLTVPVSGNYTITLDLSNPNNYNYTLHKN